MHVCFVWLANGSAVAITSCCVGVISLSKALPLFLQPRRPLSASFRPTLTSRPSLITSRPSLITPLITSRPSPHVGRPPPTSPVVVLTLRDAPPPSTGIPLPAAPRLRALQAAGQAPSQQRPSCVDAAPTREQSTASAGCNQHHRPSAGSVRHDLHRPRAHPAWSARCRQRQRAGASTVWSNWCNEHPQVGSVRLDG